MPVRRGFGTKGIVLILTHTVSIPLSLIKSHALPSVPIFSIASFPFKIGRSQNTLVYLLPISPEDTVFWPSDLTNMGKSITDREPLLNSESGQSITLP